MEAAVLERTVVVRGLERHSHNPDAHDLLARIAVDQGDLQRALGDCETAVNLQPDSSSALVTRASIVLSPLSPGALPK